MSDFIEYPNRQALFQGLADVVADQLQTALSAKGHATFAVPGGTTPAPFFEILRKKPLDWASVSIMLTDERFVAETSDRSNTRLLRETLLQDAASKALFVPMYQRASQPEAVLDYLSQHISAALPLDVCVLGMGADMHTASLFPGADLLDQALSETAPVLLAMRAPGAPEPRMTLTAPVLRGAKSVHVLIAGGEKRVAYNTATKEGPWSEAPIRIVMNKAQFHYAD